METHFEWNQRVPKQLCSYLSTEELIDIGRTVAIAAPECRWGAIKEWAQYLHLMKRLPYLQTLDDYMGTVVSVAYDCSAEQAIVNLKLDVLQQDLDSRRRMMLHDNSMSDKIDYRKQKTVKAQCKKQSDQA